MKAIYKILAVLLALCFAATGFAASVTDNEHGVLKLDRKNTDMLPDNFRTSDYAFEKDLLGGKTCSAAKLLRAPAWRICVSPAARRFPNWNTRKF